MPQLYEEQQNICDKNIPEQEILISIKQLTSRQKIGTDGSSLYL